MIEKSFFKLMDLMGPFENKPHIAVGVSGGSDSMCLCLLCNKWIQKNGGRLTALILDHGLQKNQKKKYQQIQNYLNKKKITNYYFKWNSVNNSSGFQKKARDYRYKILEKWCFKKNIFHLFMGHHFDDQKETLFIRLNSNSNVYGLSCMSTITFKKEVRILRPLLEMNKEKIKNYLIKENFFWFEDKTNISNYYTRNRYRKILPDINKFGLTDKKFKKIFVQAKKNRKLFENQVLNWLVKNVEINPLGYACILIKNLSSLPQEKFIFIINRILITIAGKIYPPKTKTIINFYKKVKSKKINSFFNLGGCHVFFDKLNLKKIFICREIIRKKRKLLLYTKNEKIIWDNRYEIKSNKVTFIYLKKRLGNSIFIDQLKSDGWEKICLIDKNFKKNKSNLPLKFIFTLPTLKNRNMNILSIPSLKYFSNRKNRKFFSNIDFHFKPILSLSRFN